MRFTWATAGLALNAAVHASPLRLAELPTTTCKFDARKPETWKDSGAAIYVDEWLNDNGSNKWLYKMDMEQTGGSSAVECSGTSGQACPVPEGSDCPNYNPTEFFYVRTIASRVNEAFRYARDKLLSNTLATTLSISTIVEDFKLPEPDPAELTKLLRSLGAASSMSDKIIKQAKVLGPVADFLGFLGGIIQIAAIHSPAPEVRDYAKFQTEMESYLSKIFTSTEKLLHETIVAIFGEGAGDEENDPQKIKDVLKFMSSKGRTDIDYNSKQPVAELLKGGAMMVPVQQSEIGKSIDEAIEILQHGIIGRYLTSLRVYVEYFEPYHKTEDKDIPKCGSKGAYDIDGKCYILRRIESGKKGNDRRPKFEDKYLDAMEKYGIDIQKFVANVVQCNNGELEEDHVEFDGDYPKCFFGMPVAIYADNYRDWDRPSSITDKTCHAQYRNFKDLPDWLTGNAESTCNRVSTPEVVDCTIHAPAAGDPWTEAALDRRRVHIKTEGIDAAEFKEYYYDGRQCVGISNRQYYPEKDGSGYILDGNAAKGIPGWRTWHNCMVDRLQNWADKRGCKLDSAYTELA
ncbi:hypothetical protein P152DRAFT_476957 [Eremomyces bilateralis CBS 781.70]|uniref:Uncharacterized protein n=1 Tax=Eremomyces bilateralis CBS 781.70 TaxID=1392243 RepID=A0A6G1FT57_9PEZI|nr:uncharacterized protein P152DRAFT_476957 [Eremomyces bilateralis CBS 781.70]KAF1808859.1 hypothetical protein P152DRAFT_476957 [Eremomyces bilateralis CBS 781.70]